jgi:two-component system response regulator MprA
MLILVAEDEEDLALVLRQGLTEHNHTVALAMDGEEALQLAETHAYDALILDIMMPIRDGLDVTRALRRKMIDTPILILTARDTNEDIVMGLDAGADDYLVKPFSLKVLLARLRALIRRGVHPPTDVLKVSDLLLDPLAHHVISGGYVVSITPTEYRILEHLMRRAGRVASRDSIIDSAWGPAEEVEYNTVDSYIKSLRDKLERNGQQRVIHTVRGYGYVARECA